jgi:hypothetical protein
MLQWARRIRSRIRFNSQLDAKSLALRRWLKVVVRVARAMYEKGDTGISRDRLSARTAKSIRIDAGNRAECPDLCG